MNGALLSWTSPEELAPILARRLRDLRLSLGWTQADTAARAGVTLASFRRFERQGKASLDLLLRVALALGRLDEVAQLFLPPPARTMAQLEASVQQSPRKRGRS